MQWAMLYVIIGFLSLHIMFVSVFKKKYSKFLKNLYEGFCLDKFQAESFAQECSQAKSYIVKSVTGSLVV